MLNGDGKLKLFLASGGYTACAGGEVNKRREVFMKRVTRVVFLSAALAGAALLTGVGVEGKILNEGAPEQKQRKDIGKQGAKHALCMAKAALKCEANGVSDAPECNLTNPAMSTVPDPKGKIIPKLTAALNKCTDKLDYAKKSATGTSIGDYTAIGCPGDSDPGTAGDQPYADLAAFQAAAGPNTRNELDLLGVVLDAICANNDCAVTQGLRGLKYAKGLFKCIEKCENDYKNQKGDGGPNDDTNKCNPSGGDPNFNTCAGEALTKATSEGPLNAVLKTAIDGAIANASNDLYNEDDCP